MLRSNKHYFLFYTYLIRLVLFILFSMKYQPQFVSKDRRSEPIIAIPNGNTIHRKVNNHSVRFIFFSLRVVWILLHSLAYIYVR